MQVMIEGLISVNPDHVETVEMNYIPPTAILTLVTGRKITLPYPREHDGDLLTWVTELRKNLGN
jgi:uncharacterized protein YlzI (FlbEa/FlbD family)